MSVAYLVLVLALTGAAAAVAAFAWVVRSGQLDDIDTPPRRILFDDEARTGCSGGDAGRNGCAMSSDPGRLRRHGPC